LALSTGGIGWIPNLTEVDHSLILPVFMALFNLTIIQIQVMSQVGASSRVSDAIMNILRVLCIVMVPIAAYAPAVTYYIHMIDDLSFINSFILTGCCALLDSIIILRTGPEYSPTFAKLQKIFPDTSDTSRETPTLSTHHQSN
jgi:hypothetical protein